MKASWISGGIIFVLLVIAVFQTEFKVQKLRAELKKIERSMVTDQENIAILEAEWTYLNQAQRLKELSAQYLSLRPTQASQIRPIESIPMREIKSGPVLEGSGA